MSVTLAMDSAAPSPRCTLTCGGRGGGQGERGAEQQKTGPGRHYWKLKVQMSGRKQYRNGRTASAGFTQSSGWHYAAASCGR